MELQVDFTAKKRDEVLHPDSLPQIPRDMLLYCNKLCEYILIAARKSVELQHKTLVSKSKTIGDLGDKKKEPFMRNLT